MKKEERMARTEKGDGSPSFSSLSCPHGPICPTARVQVCVKRRKTQRKINPHLQLMSDGETNIHTYARAPPSRAFRGERISLGKREGKESRFSVEEC